MKYRGLIITMIVMLSIIIVLLLGVLYLGINNTGFIQLGFFSGNKADKIIYDKGYDVGLINNIEVLSSAGDVKIEESNDSNVRVLVYGKEDDGLRVDLENGNLKVYYREHHKHHIISFGGYLSEIIIYVPKTYDKNLDLKLDYGDLDITSIENASIKVNESCGDIKAGKVKNIEIDNDYGNVKIEEVLNRLNIKTDCGNVKIGKVNLKEDSSIKCDMGDVKIEEKNDIYVDAKVDLGDCKIGNNNRHSEITLKVDMSCGDIKIAN